MGCEDNCSSTPFKRTPGGIFMTKGMGVRIPAGGLVISLNPKIESKIELHVVFDVFPIWLDIAFRRLLEATSGRDKLVATWATADDERVSVALEYEFEASMQS